MLRYFALSCHALTRPIKANIDRYKDHLFWRRETVSSGTIFYNDFSVKISIYRLALPRGFGFENKGTEALSFRQVYWCFFEACDMSTH